MGFHRSVMGQSKSAAWVNSASATTLTGPEELFEGHLGWARCVAGEVDFEKLLSPFDKKHPRILDTCMKPYAAEAMTMGPIQAAIDVMRENNLGPAEIKSVVIKFPHYALHKPSWD